MLRSYSRQVLPVSAILLLAAGLRLINLGAGNLWLDEAVEFWAASEKFIRLFDTTRFTILDPPLYTFFLHFWSLIGVSEFHLRFPSVIFGILGIAGSIAIGFELGGEKTGWLAGLLLAVSPASIRYAQETGQYALMLCLVTWNYYVLILIFQSERPGWPLYQAWLVLAILATYTQYVAFFAVVIPFGIHILMNLLSKDWPQFGKRSVILLLYAISLLPLITYYLPYQLTSAQDQGSLQATFAPALGSLFAIVRFGIHKVSFLFTGYPFTYIPEWIPFGIFAFLLVENLLTIRRASKINRIWLLYLTGLFVIYSIVSLGDHDPGNYRHGIFLSVALIPYIAQRLSELSRRGWKRWLSISLFWGLVSISLISSPQQGVRESIFPDHSWSWPEPFQNFKPAVRYWIDNSRSDEPIYVYSASVPAFRYYLRLFGEDRCLEDVFEKPCPASRLIAGEWFRKKPPNVKMKSVKRSIPDGTQSLWLFLSNVYSNEDRIILKGFGSDYNISRQWITQGIQLYHLVRKP